MERFYDGINDEKLYEIWKGFISVLIIFSPRIYMYKYFNHGCFMNA